MDDRDPRCGCATQRVMLNRAERRRWKQLFGEDVTVTTVHADHCPLANHTTSGWHLAGKARSMWRRGSG